MWTKRLQRMIEKNQNDLVGILLRKYPAFVLNDREDVLTDIPVFVFHEVTPHLLEPIIEFLVENKYRTLTADEYVDRTVSGQGGQEREVLLTFDDGDKSLYAVAYPALKRYGLKAVAYVVPGMIPEEDDGLGSSNVWEKRLCNWKEIEEMHGNATLDIQSHSMYHHSIPISERLIDFIAPNVELSFLNSDYAPLIGGIHDNQSQEAVYGTPIYNWGSRFSATPALCESPSVAITCRKYVKEHGGVEYFRLPDWRIRLKRVWKESRGSHLQARFEVGTEQRKAILKDFLESKRDIERRLPEKKVRHFCYPWFRGSPLAVELSAEAGYISNAWGSLVPGFARNVRAPITIPRLSPHYIWRLPGKGRKPIGEVLRERFFQVYKRGSVEISSVGRGGNKYRNAPINGS
jgi:peptidoglycan/xylan/chitin deacetylase (PgdA/CDA1 family)